tara:strand:+ start:119 stop:748 length:630 start_codon:yes stop_codon:yes gene_type:complete
MPTTSNMENVNGIVIAGAITEAHTLLRTATASSSSTVSFSTRIDSSFDFYEFRFQNLHAATDQVNFQFQVNAAGDSGFNETITSTFAYVGHRETDNASTGPGYDAGFDQAQGTAYQNLAVYFGHENAESGSGVLRLYAPSSKTYVKHWTSEFNIITSDFGSGTAADRYTFSTFTAGYINDTSPIDEISFKFTSGNIDAGVIKMYGVAKA